MQLDLLIERYAYALEIIQPSAPGKIAIRFLKRQHGGTDGRHPQFVQWYRTSRGRMLYNRYAASEILRRVKTYSLFEPVAEDVREVIREVRPIIERREGLVAKLNDYNRAMRIMSAKVEPYVAEKVTDIEGWLQKLLVKRETLINDWRRGIDLADEALPDDAVQKPGSSPKTSSGARGHLHPTRQTPPN